MSRNSTPIIQLKRRKPVGLKCLTQMLIKYLLYKIDLTLWNVKFYIPYSLWCDIAVTDWTLWWLLNVWKTFFDNLNLWNSGIVMLEYDHIIKEEEEKYGVYKGTLRNYDLQMKWYGVYSHDRWISIIINTFIFGFSLPQKTRSMHKEPVFVDENNRMSV